MVKGGTCLPEKRLLSDLWQVYLQADDGDDGRVPQTSSYQLQGLRSREEQSLIGGELKAGDRQRVLK